MGKGIRFLAKTTQNEKLIKNLSFISNFNLVSLFCFMNYFLVFFCLLFFLIQIPEDILNQEFLQTRALCKFSTEFLGCWTNRIVTHIGDDTFHELTTMVQMGIVSAKLFFHEWLNYEKIPLTSSPHHLAKCVICIFAKFVCFSRIRENTKNKKWLFTRLQNSEK